MAHLFTILRIKIVIGIIFFSPLFWRGVGGEASAQVNANFSAAPITGCAPLVVSFTDLSTGNPTSWSWDLGNGNPSAVQNPNTIYSNPGVYSVTLTVTGGAFTDTEIKTNYILVYNKPSSGFTISTDTACVGQTVTFTDATVISSGGPPISTWGWDFGDGNVATVSVSSVTHTYTTPGNYPVSLIVTDANGCTGSNIQNIVIIPGPTPSFSATPTFSCAPPLTVAFTNTSTTIGPTTYLWNFGDGNTSTSPNLWHTYTTSGTFNVTLIVNQGGCIDSIVMPNYITIQSTAASFTATPTAVCTGDSITFVNTTVPIVVSSIWNFGDGSPVDTTNNDSIIHTYPTAGTFTVTLFSSDANGCINTATGIVTVNQTPSASFTADTTVSCSLPFTVNFTNTSTGGTNYTWDFGDGSPSSALQNPTHIYTSVGTFTVTLIVTNPSGPCIDTIVMPNYIIISPPVAGFLSPPDSGCVPLTINFISTSSSAVDPIATYSWTFGDGSPSSTLTNPTHTYTATGIYTVTLVIVTANGCTDTYVCTNCIRVGITPVAGFGILQDTVCYGLPVNFLDSSVNATGWLWYFGDGDSSLLQNPTHTYADTGTFQAFLIAFNNGCPDTALIQSVVILPPKAGFVFSLSCTNYYTVQFFSASLGADSLFWNFGDGSQDSSNTTNPVHTYTVTGPFTVILTAYNYATGCNNSFTASFTIAEPIASYTLSPTSGCYTFIANFTSTSQDASTYLWNFGDTSTLTPFIDSIVNIMEVIANPTYTYNIPSTYTVSLTITDINGCTNTFIDTVKSLGPLPYFYADTLTGCRPLAVTFIDTSYSDSLLTQWVWDFGDGSPLVTSNNDSTIHTYLLPGVYSVTMTVTDTNGCVKTIIKSNYIQATFPYPAFTVDTFACKLDVLTFDASATNVSGGTYIWDYGDGQQDTSNNPVITHFYTNDGLYIVSLTVTDINGCDSTLTDTVRILKPTANFVDTILNAGCGTLQVAFFDSSAGYVTSWYWDFGNGANSTLQNPVYTYTQPGIYDVTLIVTNAGGCLDTLVLDSIIVVPGPVGTFTFSPASGCNPLTVCFDAMSLNSLEYIWDFGDGTVVQPIGDDTCHTYTNPGTFTPVLILGNTLTNGNPCLLPAANVSGTVNVTNFITVSLSSPSVITVPEDSIVTVSAIYSGGIPPYTFSWSPNTAINCNTCSSVLLVGTGDTVVYTFSIYDSSGCIGSTTITVLSEPCMVENLFPNVFTPNGDGFNDLFYIPGVCPDEKYSLQIFDRWGTLLFSTSLRKNGWDGRTNAGVEAKDGTYYFVVTPQITAPFEEDKIKKGFVQLMR